MRLIDADAMIADLLTVDPRYKTKINWCCRIVNAQPTIEERKTGRWMEYKKPYDVDGEHYCYCSKCYSDAHEHHLYCPNCGAKMEVEHD